MAARPEFLAFFSPAFSFPLLTYPHISHFLRWENTYTYAQLYSGEREFVPDPDAGKKLANTGMEHTIASFLRSEKLEFSTLRHAKFSSMLLLHFLLAENKSFTTTRY